MNCHDGAIMDNKTDSCKSNMDLFFSDSFKEGGSFEVSECLNLISPGTEMFDINHILDTNEISKFTDSVFFILIQSDRTIEIKESIFHLLFINKSRCKGCNIGVEPHMFVEIDYVSEIKHQDFL